MSVQHRLLAILEEFMAKISNHEIEVYNEFSLQHELGIFLRKSLETEHEEYKIQFERNIGYFFNLELLKGSKVDMKTQHFGNNKTRKKEIDICIFHDKGVNQKKLVAAIELKFPRNGAIPESMYSFVKDLKFLESLTANNNDLLSQNSFAKGYFICLVDDKGFYSGSKRDQIYSYFRNEDFKVKIDTVTNKPTGENKDKSEYKILLNKKYTGNWKECKENLKYLLIEVD